MTLMSVAQNCGLPAGMRLPSISTSVRDDAEIAQVDGRGAGRAIGEIVAVLGERRGNWLMMFAGVGEPSHLMSWAEITLTGLTLSSVNDGSREPVTSIFSILRRRR